MDLLPIALAIYNFLPVYFANAAPILARGKTPLDFGHVFIDGKRLFGANKTVKGFVAGLVAGTLTGLVQGSVTIGFLLALGALLGDLGGAFIKRRLGLKPGAPLPIVDQLDFVAGAILMVSIVQPPAFQSVLYVAVLTPIIHFVTNVMAYLLRLKKEPW